MSADLRNMLTLTTRANVTDYTESRTHLSAFLARMRREFPGVQYVGAPERQKRGAWHWHLLCGQYLPANVVRDLWRRVVGDGNIDLQYFEDAMIGARYAAKYISKAIPSCRIKGARYVRSRNISITPRVIGAAEVVQLLEQAGIRPEDLQPIRDAAAMWAASWVRTVARGGSAL
jgi:hypothetical protein